MTYIESGIQRQLEEAIRDKRCSVCEAVPDQLRVGYREGRFLVLCGCPGPTLEENLVPRRRSALERALAHPGEGTDAITRMQAERVIAKRRDREMEKDMPLLCLRCKEATTIIEYGGYCGNCAQDLADEADVQDAVALFALQDYLLDARSVVEAWVWPSRSSPQRIACGVVGATPGAPTVALRFNGAS